MLIVWLTFRLAPYTRTSLSLLNLLLSSTSLMRARYCSLSWPMLGDSLFTATSFPLHTAAYTLPKPPEPCRASPYQSQHRSDAQSATLQTLMWWKQSKEPTQSAKEQPSSPPHAFPSLRLRTPSRMLRMKEQLSAVSSVLCPGGNAILCCCHLFLLETAAYTMS